MSKDNKHLIQENLGAISEFFMCFFIPLIIEISANSNLQAIKLSKIDLFAINIMGTLKNLSYLLLIMSYITPNDREYDYLSLQLAGCIVSMGLLQSFIYIKAAAVQALRANSKKH